MITQERVCVFTTRLAELVWKNHDRPQCVNDAFSMLEWLQTHPPDEDRDDTLNAWRGYSTRLASSDLDHQIQVVSREGSREELRLKAAAHRAALSMGRSGTSPEQVREGMETINYPRLAGYRYSCLCEALRAASDFLCHVSIHDEMATWQYCALNAIGAGQPEAEVYRLAIECFSDKHNIPTDLMDAALAVLAVDPEAAIDMVHANLP